MYFKLTPIQNACPNLSSAKSTSRTELSKLPVYVYQYTAWLIGLSTTQVCCYQAAKSRLKCIMWKTPNIFGISQIWQLFLFKPAKPYATGLLKTTTILDHTKLIYKGEEKVCNPHNSKSGNFFTKIPHRTKFKNPKPLFSWLISMQDFYALNIFLTPVDIKLQGKNWF